MALAFSYSQVTSAAIEPALVDSRVASEGTFAPLAPKVVVTDDWARMLARACVAWLFRLSRFASRVWHDVDGSFRRPVTVVSLVRTSRLKVSRWAKMASQLIRKPILDSNQRIALPSVIPTWLRMKVTPSIARANVSTAASKTCSIPSMMMVSVARAPLMTRSAMEMMPFTAAPTLFLEPIQRVREPAHGLDGPGQVVGVLGFHVRRLQPVQGKVARDADRGDGRERGGVRRAGHRGNELPDGLGGRSRVRGVADERRSIVRISRGLQGIGGDGGEEGLHLPVEGDISYLGNACKGQAQVWEGQPVADIDSHPDLAAGVRGSTPGFPDPEHHVAAVDEGAGRFRRVDPDDLPRGGQGVPGKRQANAVAGGRRTGWSSQSASTMSTVYAPSAARSQTW